MTSRWVLGTVLLAFPLVEACGSDDDTASSGGGGSGGSVPTAGAGGQEQDAGGSGGIGGTAGTATDAGNDAGTQFEVVVYEVGPFDPAAAAPNPMEGATVALDLPDGERVEGTTGPDGKVVFGVDWSLGTVTVTAYRQGFRPITWIGLDESDSGHEFYLFDVRQPKWVHVSGTAINPEPASAMLTVSPTAAGVFHQAQGFDYSVSVAPNTPFSLVALQWSNGPATSSNREVSQDFHGWTVVDHDAIDADAALNIDLSDKLPVENVQGRIELPVDAKNPFHMGRAYYQVIARGTAVAIGFPTRTHLNEEKDAFTYEGEHVVVSNAGEVMTAYYLYYISGYPSSAAFSLLFRDGYPLDGETIGGFLAPPTILQPSDTSVSTSMSEPISWIVEDPDVESSSLAILAGQNVVWFVNVKEGSSARIPKLPSTANPISFFGMGKLSAVVMHLADCDDLFRCDRRVDSTPIPLKL